MVTFCLAPFLLCTRKPALVTIRFYAPLLSLFSKPVSLPRDHTNFCYSDINTVVDTYLQVCWAVFTAASLFYRCLSTDTTLVFLWPVQISTLPQKCEFAEFTHLNSFFFLKFCYSNHILISPGAIPLLAHSTSMCACGRILTLLKSPVVSVITFDGSRVSSRLQLFYIDNTALLDLLRTFTRC